MDVLSFNLVLSTIDNLIAEKCYDQLFYAVALYKEMISMLSALAESSDPIHRHIAVGLQVSKTQEGSPQQHRCLLMTVVSCPACLISTSCSMLQSQSTSYIKSVVVGSLAYLFAVFFVT